MNHGEFRKSPGTINRGQPEAWRDWREGMGAIHPGSEIKTESWKSMSILPRNITQEWKHRSDIYQVYKNTDTDSDASWWYFQKKKKISLYRVSLRQWLALVLGIKSGNIESESQIINMFEFVLKGKETCSSTLLPFHFCRKKEGWNLTPFLGVSVSDFN